MDTSIASGTESKYVIFSLGGGTFAVNCRYVVAIEKPLKITALPNAAFGVRGIGYYEEEAINILDLRAIFGYPSQDSYINEELAIILKVGEKKAGIIIDDAESVEAIDEIQELPPAASATEYIKKLGFRKKDKQVALIIEAEIFMQDR